MRKTTEYKAENRLTVDIEGLMAMLSCGEVTAKKIADYAEARVIVGRRVLYNVDKIKKYLQYSGKITEEKSGFDDWCGVQ